VITPAQAKTFERCMAVGGVAVFPADTVYGLACDPDSREAVQRIFMLKRRRPDKPLAVMFFALDLALAALPELGPQTVAAMRELLPGGLTLLLPNPAERYAVACGPDPQTIGLRVPALPAELGALRDVRWPVAQSSANDSGGPDARRLADIPQRIRDAADLVLDGGELPGTPSTVVDLRRFDASGEWAVVREGAVTTESVAAVLDR
jgi:L-threonylcarbamoyladenylate synthase